VLLLNLQLNLHHILVGDYMSMIYGLFAETYRFLTGFTIPGTLLTPFSVMCGILGICIVSSFVKILTR